MSTNFCQTIDKKDILALENLMIPDSRAVKILKAIAHPIRLKILRILVFNEEICTCDFSNVFEEDQPKISKQLSILMEEGLIFKQTKTKQGISGKWHAYSLINEYKFLIYSIISLFSRQSNPKVEELIKLEQEERMKLKKPNVLFLCTGNSARSQMAEAILRKKAGDYFTVYSAGTDSKGIINPFTIKVMEEVGYDMSSHRSKNLSEYLGKVHMGIQIAVCAKAAETCPTFPGTGTRLSWPFEDPASFEGSEEEKLNKFRSVRDQIEEKIDIRLQERNIESELTN